MSADEVRSDVREECGDVRRRMLRSEMREINGGVLR
jgi:hypothetical protein